MGELKVDVPGVTEDDLDIKIDDDGRLTIEGQRMVSSETSRYTSKFSKTFSLDKSVDVDMFTASLNNGVLVVSAPKDLAELEENIRRIPITASAVIAAAADDELTGEEANNNDTSKNEEGVEDEKVEVPADNDTLDLDGPNAE